MKKYVFLITCIVFLTAASVIKREPPQTIELMNGDVAVVFCNYKQTIKENYYYYSCTMEQLEQPFIARFKY